MIRSPCEVTFHRIPPPFFYSLYSDPARGRSPRASYGIWYPHLKYGAGIIFPRAAAGAAVLNFESDSRFAIEELGAPG